MMIKEALAVLICSVLLCRAEPPIRNYNSRIADQRVPYPAAGFRPDREFNLPPEDQLLRLTQLVRLQQQLQRQRQPSQLYETPFQSSPSYETPLREPSQLTRPRPAELYRAPEDTLPSQLRPQFVTPSRQYAAPPDSAASFNQEQLSREQIPSRQYGPPRESPSGSPYPEGNSDESLGESKEVETVSAVANSQSQKSSRLTKNSKQRDTENDDAETVRTPNTPVATPLVLVPLTAANYNFHPQPITTFAKFQFPAVVGVQPPKLVASPLLGQQLAYTQLQPW